jgi:hypothetical protein
MRVTAEQMAGQIASRESMAGFLDALSQDAVEHASDWENLHIFDMFELVTMAIQRVHEARRPCRARSHDR